jgi:hypothetical protein
VTIVELIFINVWQISVQFLDSWRFSISEILHINSYPNHGLSCFPFCFCSKNIFYISNYHFSKYAIYFVHIFLLALISFNIISRKEPGQRSRYSDCLPAGRPRRRSSSTSGVKNFHFSFSSRPALGSPQCLIQRVPGAIFPGVKRPGREAYHSPSTSSEIKKRRVYTSTPPCALME